MNEHISSRVFVRHAALISNLKSEYFRTRSNILKYRTLGDDARMAREIARRNAAFQKLNAVIDINTSRVRASMRPREAQNPSK